MSPVALNTALSSSVLLALPEPAPRLHSPSNTSGGARGGLQGSGERALPPRRSPPASLPRGLTSPSMQRLMCATPGGAITRG